MNVLGHTYVAEATRPGDDEYVLGAVLPDLASMGGVRLDALHPATALADGVHCHHATDASFHALRPFVDGATGLRRDLLDAGLRTGPARAVAHVGYELVLDGTLVGTATEATYRRVLVHASSAVVVDAIAPAHRGRWAAFVDRFTAAPAPPPLRYDDVAWVADRLVAILRHRPRLALDAGDVQTVADVLGRHAPSIRASAADVLASAFAPGVVG